MDLNIEIKFFGKLTSNENLTQQYSEGLPKEVGNDCLISVLMYQNIKPVAAYFDFIKENKLNLKIAPPFAYEEPFA